MIGLKTGFISVKNQVKPTILNTKMTLKKIDILRNFLKKEITPLEAQIYASFSLNIPLFISVYKDLITYNKLITRTIQVRI